MAEVPPRPNLKFFFCRKHRFLCQFDLKLFVRPDPNIGSLSAESDRTTGPAAYRGSDQCPVAAVLCGSEPGPDRGQPADRQCLEQGPLRCPDGFDQARFELDPVSPVQPEPDEFDIHLAICTPVSCPAYF